MEHIDKKQYTKDLIFVAALLVAGLAICYWIDPISEVFSQDNNFATRQNIKSNTP